MKFRRIRPRLLPLALVGAGGVPALVAAVAVAQAAVVTPPAASIPSTTTDWSGSVGIDRFDPSLGTLSGVSFGLTGTLQGSIAIESLDAEPSTVSADLRASIDLKAPGAGTVLSAAPSVALSAQLSAFDGTIDYAGPSGVTFTGLTASQSAQSSFAVGAGGSGLPTAPFIGMGQVRLPVTATADAGVSGPLNLAAKFQAAAGATVSVTYATGQSGGNGGGSAGSVTNTGTNGGIGVTIVGARHTARQTDTLPDQRSSWSRGITFQPFNPALGTLESADFTLIGDFTAGLGVTDTGPRAGQYSATQSVAFALLGSDGVTLNSQTGNLDRSGTIAAGVSIATGGSAAVRQRFSVDDPAELALLTGADAVALGVDATGSLTAEVPGNALLTSNGLAGATITLSYTYLPGGNGQSVEADGSAVPEPGSLALLATGLAGLVAGARRRA